MSVKRKRTRTPIVRTPDFCAKARELYTEYGTAEAVALEMGADRTTIAKAIKEGPIIPRLLRKKKASRLIHKRRRTKPAKDIKREPARRRKSA